MIEFGTVEQLHVALATQLSLSNLGQNTFMQQPSDPLPGVRDAAVFRLPGPDLLNKLRAASSNSYEIRVFMAAGNMVRVFEELEHVVALLHRAISFHEISALLKLYITSWVSLTDMAANLINEVYDLGYAGLDVKFGALLRNRHILSTQIPAIVRRHATSTQHKQFAKLRNDIVHRGTLDDPELTRLSVDWSHSLLTMMLGVDRTDRAAMEEAARRAAEECDLKRRIRELIVARAEAYAEQLCATRALLADIAPILVTQIQLHKQAV